MPDDEANAVFMRPHEVLLSGKGDLMAKLILYASLLEQMEIPFLLVYQSQYAMIGVQGTFPLENGMSFGHGGKQYTLAEISLADGFEPGKSPSVFDYKWATVRLLQYPGRETRLFDVKLEDSLDSVEVPVRSRKGFI